MFTNGNEWLRVDLHLHTVSDSEFKYNRNSFEEDYINALDKADIKIATITNHKFNKKEFLQLNSLAKEKNIWLLPGVELEVRDGRSGLHALFIFYENEVDYLEYFISNCYGFGRKSKSLDEVISFLDQEKKEYILILAHVENSKGLFKELKPANYQYWIEQDFFRNKILALQDASKGNIKKFENEIKK
ncbi:hypothetical protein [Deferribacter abyssi]|uniref:hypothetical protein n=1 Tax=Deferribacter abyssi TaxID=213806 RepID=UPI003C1F765C